MAKPGPDRSYTDEEVVRVIVSAPTPAVGTHDIAEAVGVSRQAAERGLEDMVERGLLKTGKISGVNTWWTTEKGRAILRHSDQ